MNDSRAFYLALLFGAVMAMVAVLSIGLAPVPGSNVIVFVSPFSELSAFHAIAAADGELVTGGFSSWTAIAAPRIQDSADFVSRLYGKGAFLVLDASAALACLQFI